MKWLLKLGLLKSQTCFSCHSSATKFFSFMFCKPPMSLFRQTGCFLVRNWSNWTSSSSTSTYHENHCLSIGFLVEPRLSVLLSLGIFWPVYNWPVKPSVLLSRHHQSWRLEETWWCPFFLLKLLKWGLSGLFKHSLTTVDFSLTSCV